jgi:hypothetical protein
MLTMAAPSGTGSTPAAVTPRPGEPDRLAGGGEPARPAQPAGHRQRGDRPGPVQPRGQDLRAGQVPGSIQQLMPQRGVAGAAVPPCRR